MNFYKEYKIKFILLFVRKLLSYCLFFVLAWQIIGFVVYFEFKHYQVKKEIKTVIKKGVPKDELVIFELDEKQMKELIWRKKNEFELKGNLFDVVRKHKMDSGKTYMECISDKQETVLFAKLNQTISINLGDDHHPSSVSNWMKILHFPVMAEFNEIHFQLFSFDLLKSSKFHYLESDSLKSVDILTPPPKHIS